MKIASLTATTVTFDIEPHEREELASILGKKHAQDLAVHWIGPRDSDWWKEWRAASKVTRDDDRPKVGATFTVEPGHLALLRRAYTDWNYCEFGAMEINPKRPYGNSDVMGDLAEILGVDLGVDEDGDQREPSPEFTREAYRFHRETEFCVQILLTFGAIEDGATYRNDARSNYSRPAWVKV